MHMPNVVTRHKQFTENDWQAMAFDYVQKQYGEEADVSTRSLVIVE
jgi:hypothetical protein